MQTDTHTSIQLKATVLVTLSGILYGFLGFFGTEVLHENYSVSNMLFWRFLIAFVWILGYSLINREALTISPSAKRVLVFTFFLGSLFYSGSSAFYFLASEYTGTGLAMVIFFCYPVFVALYAWTTRSGKMNPVAVASLFAIILGLYLLKGQGVNALSLTGIMFAILAAVSYALYIIGSKPSTGQISATLLTVLICLGNTLIFLIGALATKSFVIPTHLMTWLDLIALGIFATALPIQLLLKGLKFVTPLKASIISVLEPVVTLIVGVILLQETINPCQKIGIFIVLAGAILIQFEKPHAAVRLELN